MRYISHINRLALVRENGQIAYQFENGELIVGAVYDDDGANVVGTGNEIDAKTNATDGTKLQVVGTGTGLQLVGKDELFWEAPDQKVAADPGITDADLTVGSWYKVLAGTITHEGTEYTAPARFKATATSAFTGTGTVRFDIPEEYYDTELNERAESFRKAHLWKGDEATWDDTAFAPTEKTIGWLR